VKHSITNVSDYNQKLYSTNEIAMECTDKTLKIYVLVLESL